MRRDYAHALAMAEAYTAAQADALAGETGAHAGPAGGRKRRLCRRRRRNQSAAGIVDASDGGRILNVALADADGHFVLTMKGQALAARALPEPVLERAQLGHAVEAFSDPAIGSSPLTLVFRADKDSPPRFIVVPLDPLCAAACRQSGGNTALFDFSGALLALGHGWNRAPPDYVLRIAPGGTALRYIEYDGARRIIALSSVPGWPLAAAASVRADDALDTWYGSLPLYLFVIAGTGAGQAHALGRRPGARIRAQPETPGRLAGRRRTCPSRQRTTWRFPRLAGADERLAGERLARQGRIRRPYEP